jgi:hypothetical protein
VSGRSGPAELRRASPNQTRDYGPLLRLLDPEKRGDRALSEAGTEPP